MSTTLSCRSSRSSALAALFAFVVYLPRVAPTLTLMGDSAVFVSAATTWGVPQPSGYPLWTALGFLWSKLPLGDPAHPAHRLHLLSAVLHALTVFVVGCTIAGLTRSRLAAFTGALWLAFSRAFFLGSLYTEVFPLNDLFAALALYGGLLVYREPTRRHLAALALIAGLASAHHQTIALLAPALAVLVSKGVRRVRREHFAIFLAPIVLFYGLIPLAARREPFASWGDVRSLSALVALATRRDYGGLTSPHLGGAAADASALVSAWIDGTLLAFTGWVILAIAIGLWAGFRTDRRVLVALCLAVLVPGPIFAVLNRLEIDTEHGRAFAERFSTEAAIPIALLIGLGVAFAYRELREQLPASFLRVALGLSAMIPLARHGGDCDLRDDRRGLAVAHDTLHDIPDGSLVLVAGDALNGAALYLCAVEQRCGRTIVFSPGQMHLDWRVTQLRRRYPELSLPAPAAKFLTAREIVAANLPKRPIYLSTQLLDLEPALRDSFDFLPFGLLVRVLRPEDTEAFKTGFVARARELSLGEGFEGTAMTRGELREPSLETGLPFLYALAYENHARVLGAFFQEPELTLWFEQKAERTDPEAIHNLRTPEARP